jgi:hypothetical protein
MNEYSIIFYLLQKITPGVKDLELTLVILSTYWTVLMTFKPCLNAVFMENMSTSR